MVGMVAGMVVGRGGVFRLKETFLDDARRAEEKEAQRLQVRWRGAGGAGRGCLGRRASRPPAATEDVRGLAREAAGEGARRHSSARARRGP